MSHIGTNTSDNNYTMTNNTNNKVSSGMINSIEKIDSVNTGLRRLAQTPGI